MAKNINFRTAHNKGCQGIYQVIHGRCEDGQGNWKTECPQASIGSLVTNSYIANGRVKSSKTLSDPAWHEVKLITNKCTPKYNQSQAHDKGCSSGGRVWHARCEYPNGTSSQDCPEKPKAGQQFKGVQIIKSKPIDNYWQEVVIADPNCVVNYNQDGAHDKGCQKGVHTWHSRCEKPDGSHSTDCSNQQLPKIGDLFKGQPVTAIKKIPSNPGWIEIQIDNPGCGRVVYYNLHGAHDKGCADEIQTWHVRCEDHAGQFSTDCVTSQKPKAGDSFKNGIIDQVKQLQDPAWVEVKIKDGLCKLRYNEADAHDKGCQDETQTWHLRCEDGIGGFSTNCSQKIRPQIGDIFKGKEVIEVNEVSDPAWIEVKTKTECPPSTINQFMLIAGVIGGVIFLILIIILVLFFILR